MGELGRDGDGVMLDDGDGGGGGGSGWPGRPSSGRPPGGEASPCGWRSRPTTTTGRSWRFRRRGGASTNVRERGCRTARQRLGWLRTARQTGRRWAAGRPRGEDGETPVEEEREGRRWRAPPRGPGALRERPAPVG